jgi:hypothetical protein
LKAKEIQEKKKSLRHLLCAGQRNLETEPLSTCDGLTLDAAHIAAVPKICSQVVGGFLISEQRRNDHEQTVSHG